MRPGEESLRQACSADSLIERSGSRPASRDPPTSCSVFVRVGILAEMIDHRNRCSVDFRESFWCVFGNRRPHAAAQATGGASQNGVGGVHSVKSRLAKYSMVFVNPSRSATWGIQSR